MANAVGLNRLDLERMKGGEFEGILRNAESVTNVSEKTAAGLAAFALQLDNLTTSIKTNFIKVMGRYSGDLTEFVKKINEATDMLARYILSGDMENDLKMFGYELVHWMNKYLPGVNISEGKEAKQYFSAKKLREAGEEFAEAMGKIPKSPEFQRAGPEQTAGMVANSLRRLQEAINKSEASGKDKEKVIESAARAADSAIGNRVNLQFTVSAESNASVSLKATPVSSGATPFKTGQ
jgi:hypothetical protein